MRTIEKASGRQDQVRAPSLYQSPLVARPLFQSFTLTESLEQAKTTHLLTYFLRINTLKVMSELINLTRAWDKEKSESPTRQESNL